MKDEKGRDYQGYIQAKNKKEAQAALDTRGFYLTSLKRAPQVQFTIMRPNITKMDIIVFARQLSTMLGTGLPITRSLAAMSEQADNDKLKAMIDDLRVKIEGGSKLSEAMERHRDAFSTFVVSMVRTGETGGMMDEMFRRIALYLEKEEDLRRKVASAVAYPAIVAVATVAVVLFLIVFVVPAFQQVYSDLGAELPLPTRMLIRTSVTVRQNWPGMLVFFGALFAGYLISRRLEKGRYLIDKFKISAPIVGNFNRKISVSRFVRSLGALIASGITITRALDIADTIPGNRVVARYIDNIRAAVNRGENISVAMRYGKIFPPIVIQMVAAGEESGALDNMLEKSADFLDQDIDTAVKKITIKIEPMLTAILAVVVGFIALAIYLPMFDIVRHIRN